MNHYFTFGHGHYDKTHENLSDYYTIINAPTEDLARDIMFKIRGNKWSMVYESKEEASVDDWDLKYIDIDLLTDQPGETR